MSKYLEAQGQGGNIYSFRRYGARGECMGMVVHVVLSWMQGRDGVRVGDSMVGADSHSNPNPQ